jgi:hypothetical protein
MATHFVDKHVDFTIGGRTLTPTQAGNVQYIKPSHEVLQLRLLCRGNLIRDAVREKHFSLIYDDDLPKYFFFSHRFTNGDSRPV